MKNDRKKVLISACLLGVSCRYDGKSNELQDLERLREAVELVPFCPEVYGGLATPREPSEIREGSVVTKTGKDVTAEFEKGAEEALRVAKLLGCEAAILKERSPSCGNTMVYDGTFSGKKIFGQGKTAALLAKNGIPIYNEEKTEECIRSFVAEWSEAERKNDA